MPIINNVITLFSVVREATPGTGDWTNYAEQDNLPTLEEVSAPVGAWNWDTDGILSGAFIGAPSISITPISPDGRIAQIEWSGIVPSDWRNGTTGTFLVTLTDDNGNIRGPYTIGVRVRSIEHIKYTVIQGQTMSGTNPVNGVIAGETHDWSSIDAISGCTTSFDPDGRINVSYGGDWSNVDGTFSLTIGNGAGKPDSTFDGTRTGGGASLPRLKLRRLIGDGYTIIQNQTSGGEAITGPPAEEYVFGPANLPPGVSLDLSPRGAVISATSPNWEGASDGTFELEIQDGRRPSSFFLGLEARALSFRSLTGNGYLFIQGQSSSGQGINVAPAHSYAFSVSELPPGGDLALDNMGSVLSASALSDTTFDLEIQDGARPSSTFVGLPLEFRSIDPIRIPCDGGPVAVTVNGEGGNPWDWQAFAETLPATVVTPSLGVSTTGMTLTPTIPTLQPGECGTATITLQKVDGGGVPIRPWSTVEVPISSDICVHLKGAPGIHALPGGRARMRYQAEIEADCALEAGKELLWSVDFGGDTGMASALSLASAVTASTDNVLETPYDSGTGTSTYLPDVPSATVKSFTVTVIKRDTSTLETCATGGPVTFTLPVEPSKDLINTTVLLDRSGSMGGQHRWQAACSGAGSFAILVHEAVYDGAGPHKLGVYWFNSGASPAAAFQNASAESYSINGGVALNDAAIVSTTCASMSPSNATALGRGMLLCRDALNAVDTGAEEKVLLVLSDGMENQSPLSTEIFFNPASTSYWGTPNVRVYPMALMTGGTWVDRLRNIVGATGGLPSLDVASIPSWTSDTPHKINNWFITHFTNLYGFTQLVTPPDPALARGKTALHKVPVNLGQNKLVFFVTHDEPKPADWQFDLELPCNEGTITKSTAQGADGIRYFETSMSKMYIIDFPVRLPGLEHSWAGDWQMKVTRKGAGTGHYGVGALAKQDVCADIQLLAGASPVPGDTATLRVQLTDPNGKPIVDAKVTAAVTAPGEWIGDKLTKTARKDPSVYRLLARSKSALNADIESAADKLWQHLQAHMKAKSGPVKNVTLKHLNKGVYTATFKLEAPGDTNVDVAVQGVRTALKKDLSTLKQTVLKAATVNLEAMADGLKKREISAAKKRAVSLFTAAAVSARPFSVQTRRTVKVGFVPDADKTVRYGFLEDASTLCLFVEPKDKDGRLLGPGYADQVKFITPVGAARPYPAKDMLDGTYELELPMIGSEPVLGLANLAVVSKKLTLGAGADGKSAVLKNGSLPLERFSVAVLGHRLPLTVFALAGNKKTKQAHFVTCTHVTKINDENFEWFKDLKDIQQHGYDTCELCMPLIMNTATKEVHKPLCTRVSKIKTVHRKEVRSHTIALKQGGDGCKYCLPGSHTR